jgi:hypothetical protein
MVHPCSAPDCSTLTMGTLCVEHECTLPAAATARPHSVAFAALACAAAGLVAALVARARIPL